MWQRIQTLWLLLAGISMTLLLFIPIVYWNNGNDTIEMFTLWTKSSTTEYIYHLTWELFMVALIVVILSFVCILLYKKRRVQMRLTIFSVLLILGYIIDAVVRIYFFSTDGSILSNSASSLIPTPTLWCVLPFFAIIFEILAFRGIRRDDVLIRMSNRLR